MQRISIFFLSLIVSLYAHLSLHAESDALLEQDIAVLEVPRKVIKRLALLKEKVYEDDLIKMPAFNFITQLQLDQDKEIAQDLVARALGELEQYSADLALHKKQGDTITFNFYIDKIKKDLFQVPVTFISRAAAVNGAICCQPTCPQSTSCTTTTSCCINAAAVQGATTNETTIFTNPVSITNIAQSSNPSSGALTVAGGVGIRGNLSVGGIEQIFNTTQSTNTLNGALVVAGGV